MVWEGEVREGETGREVERMRVRLASGCGEEGASMEFHGGLELKF